MQGNIEWKVGEIRIGKEDFGYGDPYIWSCSVMRDGDVAILSRAEAFDSKLRKELRRLLKKEGFTSLVFDRYKDGKKERITILV